MHRILRALIGLMALSVFTTPGCGERPIGQPCSFSWPEIPAGEGITKPDCAGFPECHPLQELLTTVKINNKGCPVDCIQMQSSCDSLYCVATQISEGEHKFTKMNGQCWNLGDQGYPTPDTECIQDNPPVVCGGYCSKDCLSNASCPKGYSCSSMAPFAENLDCLNEENWGETCTESCTKTGFSPGKDNNIKCPNTAIGWDTTICEQKAYSKCCACICNQFCPILEKKFCRKKDWDQKMFPNAIVAPGTSCGAT